MIQPSNYWAHIKVNTLKRIIGPIQSIPLFHPPQFTKTAFPSLMARSRVCPGFFFSLYCSIVLELEAPDNTGKARECTATEAGVGLEVTAFLGCQWLTPVCYFQRPPLADCFVLFFIRNHFIQFSLSFFFYISHVWFYSRSLGYLVFGSLLPKQCPVWNPSSGMVLKTNQALVGYSSDFCCHHSPLPSCILHAGEIVGQRFCDTIGVCISLLVSCRVPSYIYQRD